MKGCNTGRSRTPSRFSTHTSSTDFSQKRKDRRQYSKAFVCGAATYAIQFEYIIHFSNISAARNEEAARLLYVTTSTNWVRKKDAREKEKYALARPKDTHPLPYLNLGSMTVAPFYVWELDFAPKRTDILTLSLSLSLLVYSFYSTFYYATSIRHFSPRSPFIASPSDPFFARFSITH